MNAHIKVAMDNAAFADFPASELGRILRKLADEIEADGPDSLILRDINGNVVGSFTLSQD